jgi:hypothetical protein
LTSGSTLLVTKRAEMAGLIEHHRKEMGRLAVDLAYLDATLKLFSPEIVTSQKARAWMRWDGCRSDVVTRRARV